MLRHLVMLTAVSLSFGCATSAQQKPDVPVPDPFTEVRPETTDAGLFNPGMGLYLQYPPMDAKADEWFMQISDIAYYRLDWADVNPEENVYRFDEYFGPKFDFWVKQHGKRVAFRVMCSSMHSKGEFVTPAWVFAKGVPSVRLKGVYGQEQTDPVFWDERYVELQCEFIRKLGAYLDGKPGLEFVDIGSIGEWGEMHLMRWSSALLEQTGFTHTKYVMAYRRVIDAHVEAFPRTRVFLNIGGQDNHTINDYAAIRGVHFRQDGLMPNAASYNCGEWLYKPYARRGVVCNFEFHSGYDEMLKKGWSVPATIDRGLDAPISYLNTNLFGGGGYRKAPDEGRQELTRAARKVGYRFVTTRVRYPREFRVAGSMPSRVPLASGWRNDGVAPCYASYATRWSLTGSDGKAVVSEIVFPRTPTTMWWPGEEQSVETMLRIPPQTAPGEYKLTVAMFDPATGSPIRLGLAGGNAAGEYLLATLTGVAKPAEPALVYEENFEGAAPVWPTPVGVTASVESGPAHTGERTLTVAGTCVNTWNYASVTLPVTPPAGSRIRFSGWMFVEKIEPGNKPPYLKIGINDRDGRWLTNFSSAKYDLAQLGTWQKLEGVAEIPMNIGAAVLAVERGQIESDITVKLRLDDLRVEVTESL